MMTNPAWASVSDDTQLTFHYKRSRLANYEIPSASFATPFFRRTTGWRYAGAGINVIRQQAGPNGLYKITGATGTFAYTVRLSSTSQIAGGIGGGIMNKKVDAAITTDSQFNFGAYDPSLPNGENFQFNSITRPVINTGICWVLSDRYHHEKASFGIAAYNVNRPSFDLLHSAAPDPVTYVVTGELDLISLERFSISPTFRYINNGTSFANLGARLSYKLGLSSTVLGAGAWYKTTGAGVVALQCERETYVLAASMDFSIASGQGTNINNAVELSLGWRFHHKKSKHARETSAPAPVSNPTEPQPVVEQMPVIAEVREEEAKKEMRAQRIAGAVLTPEEERLAEVRIQFQLGSEAVSAAHEAFLDKLVATLISHPDHRLRITGHTCTVGDQATNERVSYERAETVAAKLIAKGVPADRLLVIGMDIQKPIASNDTEEGRQQNRRVEFEWIKK